MSCSIGSARIDAPASKADGCSIEKNEHRAGVQLQEASPPAVTILLFFQKLGMKFYVAEEMKIPP
ncbi:hypothetical protein [Rhizobium miluonense]|uniref:hypothetical protein n=1 Tax=Rhizobium miluonense TaxID=411945 RepID=UPI000B8876B5|nr:hypothetical protein [Rhizobium miluonense]